MSRSRTYRPVQLSAAEVAAIAERSRRERVQASVLPILREQIELAAAEMARNGQLPAVAIARLGHDVALAGSVSELTVLASAIESQTLLPEVRVSSPTSKMGLPLDSLELTSIDLTPHRRPIAFETAVLAVELELDSIDRAAGELHLELDGVAALRARVDIARSLIACDVHPEATIVSLRKDLNVIDRALDLATAEAECRRQTMDAVVGILRSMGYNVGPPQLDVDGTVLGAVGSNGRTARVALVGGTEGVGIDATFADASHAVPSDHVHAEAVCEPAVMDQITFQREVEQRLSFAVGAVKADGQPTRASLSAPRSSRRQHQDAPRARRRTP